MFYPLLSRLDPVKTICFVLFLLTGSLLGGIRAGATEENPLRVLIITGGHHFERTAFLQCLKPWRALNGPKPCSRELTISTRLRRPPNTTSLFFTISSRKLQKGKRRTWFDC